MPVTCIALATPIVSQFPRPKYPQTQSLTMLLKLSLNFQAQALLALSLPLLGFQVHTLRSVVMTLFSFEYAEVSF